MCVVNYKFTSKTGGFESYDSHQLLCGWMVKVNSKPFRIVSRDLVGVYICTVDRLEDRKWCGLIGSLPANQVAVVSIHLF